METLTDQQIQYSACDVYAALAVYDVLSAIPLPAPLASNAEPLSPVLLYNTDNSHVIAWGVLSPDSTCCFDGINVTATCCLVEIHNVYVPGAIITTPRQQPLSEFGQTPFSLFACAPISTQLHPNSPPSNPASKACSAQGSDHSWCPLVHTHIVKDPFHVFNMFYISVTHGLQVDFSLSLHDAIFIPYQKDKMHIIAWGAAQDPPLTWDHMLRTWAKWLWHHCEQSIPPPKQLYLLNVSSTHMVH
jgi:hypothetical protein